MIIWYQRTSSSSSSALFRKSRSTRQEATLRKIGRTEKRRVAVVSYDRMDVLSRITLEHVIGLDVTEFFICAFAIKSSPLVTAPDSELLSALQQPFRIIEPLRCGVGHGRVVSAAIPGEHPRHARLHRRPKHLNHFSARQGFSQRALTTKTQSKSLFDRIVWKTTSSSHIPVTLLPDKRPGSQRPTRISQLRRLDDNYQRGPQHTTSSKASAL